MFVTSERLLVLSFLRKDGLRGFSEVILVAHCIIKYLFRPQGGVNHKKK